MTTQPDCRADRELPAATDRSDRSPASDRLETIDCLRGVAALAVCCYHLTRSNLMTFDVPALRWLFGWGAAGVDIFFVISGFIIPYTMMCSAYRVSHFGAFFGRRLIRLAPPSWIQIASMLALFLAISATAGSGPAWMGAMSASRILHNLAYTVDFTRETWINPVFWTLAVEFQFYLLVGLAFPFVFAGKRAFVVTCVMLILLRHVPVVGDLPFLKHATLFLIGGAALLHRQSVLTIREYLILVAILTLVTAIRPGAVQAGFGCATALVISFMTVRSRIGVFLGNISYSLYLTHSLTAGLTATVLTRVIAPTTAGPKMIIIAAALALVIISSWLFYRIVERPFIELAKRTFPRPAERPRRSVELAF
ncbi:acyltransferase [Sphingosinicella sp. BN140058]|uniref:acyltransferase family protein n=1 Tax=Sphingosinicella sp. BN140058 TaxID=1892855 RepID=UPI0013ED09ED|nr:acyltransferase [Sphingosinicella sp. BN140058]